MPGGFDPRGNVFDVELEELLKRQHGFIVVKQASGWNDAVNYIQYRF
jgi:hypothetical protein